MLFDNTLHFIEHYHMYLGELGKLGMLHEAILHKCIKQVRKKIGYV